MRDRSASIEEHGGVEWRETLSDGRVSSAVVIECRTPIPSALSGPPPVEDLARALAQAFFEGVPACSGGLFAATYRADPPRCAGRPLIGDVTLHARGLRRLPLLRLGRPRLLRSKGHAVLVYPVVGGPLASRPDAAAGAQVSPAADEWTLGALAFDVLSFEGSLYLSVLVCDYPPRLVGSGRSAAREVLYLVTQSPLHRMLVTRFLRGAVGRVTRLEATLR